jgi:hypothetical protein
MKVKTYSGQVGFFFARALRQREAVLHELDE